jgi:hypothetical protein
VVLVLCLPQTVQAVLVQCLALLLPLAVAVQVLSEAMVQDLLLLAQGAQEPHQALRVFL